MVFHEVGEVVGEGSRDYYNVTKGGIREGGVSGRGGDTTVGVRKYRVGGGVEAPTDPEVTVALPEKSGGRG